MSVIEKASSLHAVITIKDTSKRRANLPACPLFLKIAAISRIIRQSACAETLVWQKFSQKYPKSQNMNTDYASFGRIMIAISAVSKRRFDNCGWDAHDQATGDDGMWFASDKTGRGDSHHRAT